jgi:hypothetical protein
LLEEVLLRVHLIFESSFGLEIFSYRTLQHPATPRCARILGSKCYANANPISFLMALSYAPHMPPFVKHWEPNRARFRPHVSNPLADNRESPAKYRNACRQHALTAH